MRRRFRRATYSARAELTAARFDECPPSRFACSTNLSSSARFVAMDGTPTQVNTQHPTHRGALVQASTQKSGSRAPFNAAIRRGAAVLVPEFRVARAAQDSGRLALRADSTGRTTDSSRPESGVGEQKPHLVAVARGPPSPPTPANATSSCP